MSTMTTTTTTSAVYSVRDEMGRLLASGEYMPSVENARIVRFGARSVIR